MLGSSQEAEYLLLENYQKSEIPIYKSPRELITSDCSSRFCKKQKGNLRDREEMPKPCFKQGVSDNREKSLKPNLRETF